MRAVLRLLLTLSLALAAGCGSYVAPVRPPAGLLYTHVSAPLSTNFSKTPVCTKSGTAKTSYFHDPLLTGMDFAWGRAGIKEAAAAGGLSAVEYADYEYTLILGIYGTFQVTAYGR